MQVDMRPFGIARDARTAGHGTDETMSGRAEAIITVAIQGHETGAQASGDLWSWFTSGATAVARTAAPRLVLSVRIGGQP